MERLADAVHGDWKAHMTERKTKAAAAAAAQRKKKSALAGKEATGSAKGLLG